LREGNEQEMANNLELQKGKIQELVDFMKPIDDKAKSMSNDLSEVNQDWLNAHITGKRRR
jgi:hemerythrin